MVTPAPVASAMWLESSSKPPFGRRHAAVEDRLADQFHLHLAVEALGRADQHVLGVVVGGRAGVWRDRVRPARRSHGQRVAYYHPARGRLPGRRQHVGAGLVRPRRRDMDTERTQPERSRPPVEQAAEDARGVEPRHTQPVDPPIGSHEGTGVAVGQEGVLGDRRER